VQNKKTTWIDKTAPVQNKKDNLDRQNNTTLAVLSIQVVFFILHWYCFVYPGCLFMLHRCCFVYPGCLFYAALVLFCLSRLEKNSTSAT
jgi:hypothetical protein